MSADPGGARDLPGGEQLVRDLRNARHAYERVRGEALRYRDERDAARERVTDLAERLRDRTANLDKAKRRRDALKERVRRLEARIAELESSRGVRVEARVRRARHRLQRLLRRQQEPSAGPATTSAGAGSTAPTTGRAPGPSGVVHVASTTPVAAWLDLDAARLAERASQAEAASAALRAAGQRRERLRVAAVVDDFTRLSLAPECELVNLTLGAWQAEVEALGPDLLLVESAWRGQNGSWRDRIATLAPELRALFAWCRERSVPTVFWNKEDPVHFERYLRVAAEADFVFTTDVDKIAEYRLRLGHDRVALLPFAAQPRTHNPVEIGQRREALAFAGAYYPDFPDRMRDLRALVTGASAVMPVEIYDRNYGTTVESAQFPAEYQDHIVGTLGPDEIDLAYKGYVYGLNLNTVKDSRSMFARRVFELLASNTVTVSNHSRAVGLLFGDLVPMSDSADEMRELLARLVADPARTDRLRALGVRKVLREHTYAHRLDHVVATVSGRVFAPRRPALTVVVAGGSADSVRNRVALARRQRDVDVAVVVVPGTPEAARWAAAEGFAVVAEDRLAALSLAELAQPGTEALAVLHPDDWYDDHYLRDLADAWGYSDAGAVGKVRRFRLEATGAVVEVGADAHVATTGLALRRCAVATGAAGVVPATLVTSGGTLPDTVDQLAVHRFDYCEGGAADERASAAVAPAVPADGSIDQGVDLDLVWDAAAAVRVDRTLLDAAVLLPVSLDPEVSSDERLDVTVGAEWLTVVSRLARDETAEVAGRTRIDVAAVWPDGQARLGFRAEGDADAAVVLRLLDAAGEELGSAEVAPGATHRHELPPLIRWATVSWRVDGPGRVRCSPIHLSEWPFEAPVDLPEHGPAAGAPAGGER